MFLHYKAQKLKTLTILINTTLLFYLMSHIKFGSLNYATQLCDITAYELPINQVKYFKKKAKISVNTIKKNSSDQIIIIYNLHSYYTQSRLYFFAQNLLNIIYSNILLLDSAVDSITELFYAANWLERELMELFGINFNGKKDVRNLMLQYGDSSNPFKKLFPTIGLKELVYDIIRDLLVQLGLNTQS